MFSEAGAFNQDLSKWNVAQVTDMEMMFNGATSFKQEICGGAWVDSSAKKEAMFMDSPGNLGCKGRFQPNDKDELDAAISCRKRDRWKYVDKYIIEKIDFVIKINELYVELNDIIVSSYYIF